MFAEKWAAGAAKELTYESIRQDFLDTNYDRAISRGLDFVEQKKEAKSREKSGCFAAESSSDMCLRKSGQQVKSAKELTYESIRQDFLDTNYDRAISRGLDFVEKFPRLACCRKLSNGGNSSRL